MKFVDWKLNRKIQENVPYGPETLCNTTFNDSQLFHITVSKVEMWGFLPMNNWTHNRTKCLPVCVTLWAQQQTLLQLISIEASSFNVLQACDRGWPLLAALSELLTLTSLPSQPTEAPEEKLNKNSEAERVCRGRSPPHPGWPTFTFSLAAAYRRFRNTEVNDLMSTDWAADCWVKKYNHFFIHLFTLRWRSFPANMEDEPISSVWRLKKLVRPESL